MNYRDQPHLHCTLFNFNPCVESDKAVEAQVIFSIKLVVTLSGLAPESLTLSGLLWIL